MSYYKLRCSYLHSSLAFSLYLIQPSVHEDWKTSTTQSSGMWQHELGTMKQCFREISLIFRVHVFYNENADSSSSELFAPFMRHDIAPQKLTFTFTATITSHLTCTALELIVNIQKQLCPHLMIHVSRTVNCQDYIVLMVNKLWNVALVEWQWEREF
jgi:hypothetical protein